MCCAFLITVTKRQRGGEGPAQELKERLGDSEWLWLLDQVSRLLPHEASNHPALTKHRLKELETEVRTDQGEGGN